MKLLSPNGGEIIPAGSEYPISWEAPREAVKFVLSYTPGRKIGTASYSNSMAWSVPLVTRNKSMYRVHIKAYDSSNKKIAHVQSDHEFSIELARITAPSIGSACKSGQICVIRWAHSEYIPVTSIELSYSLNGGRTWSKITNSLSNYSNSFDWIVPFVQETQTNTKIRVILRNSSGKKIGSVVSDWTFTTKPAQ